MYGIVRDNTYDATKLTAGQAELDEFQAIHRKQPGYRGSFSVDIGNGRHIVVNLWESEEYARSALPVMVPVVQRLVEPLLSKPSHLIGTGTVVMNDLL
jgi:hypothetical protein